MAKMSDVLTKKLLLMFLYFFFTAGRYNFHVVLPTKIRLLCFSSLALTLSRFAILSPTF